MVPHLGHAELMVVVVRAGGGCAGIGQKQKKERKKKGVLHGISLGLTFAGLRALKPHVIYVFVCSTSAVLVPSTARSAATDPARFRKRAALWTCNRTKDR